MGKRVLSLRKPIKEGTILGIKKDDPRFAKAQQHLMCTTSEAARSYQTVMILLEQINDPATRELLQKRLDSLVYHELERKYNYDMRKLKYSSEWKSLVAETASNLGINWKNIDFTSPKEFNRAKGQIGGAIVKMAVEEFIRNRTKDSFAAREIERYGVGY